MTLRGSPCQIAEGGRVGVGLPAWELRPQHLPAVGLWACFLASPSLGFPTLKMEGPGIGVNVKEHNSVGNVVESHTTWNPHMSDIRSALLSLFICTIGMNISVLPGASVRIKGDNKDLRSERIPRQTASCIRRPQSIPAAKCVGRTLPRLTFFIHKMGQWLPQNVALG